MLTQLTKEQWQVYEKRVIDYYVRNKFYGVHNLKLSMGKDESTDIAGLLAVRFCLKKVAQLLSCFLPFVRWRRAFRSFFANTLNINKMDIEKWRLKREFKVGKIYLPQVEFAITTQCNLRCKHCTNYIPYLSSTQQRVMNYAEFQIYLDNLTKNITKLNTLLLLGGEPLLHKDLPKMLDYALKNKKIENVYITTNGTISFSAELKGVFESLKDKNRLWVWISNYTANERLAKRLKSYEMLDYLKEKGINYIFIKENQWGKSLPPTYEEAKRTDAENSEYFLKCNTPCVSVYGNELSVCPRASHFALKGVITQKDGERLLLDGGGGEISKADFVRFYTYTNFSACRWCDRKDYGGVMPAIQIGDEG